MPAKSRIGRLTAFGMLGVLLVLAGCLSAGGTAPVTVTPAPVPGYETPTVTPTSVSVPAAEPVPELSSTNLRRGVLAEWAEAHANEECEPPELSSSNLRRGVLDDYLSKESCHG